MKIKIIPANRDTRLTWLLLACFFSYKLPLGLGFTTKWLQSLEMLLKCLDNLVDTVNIDERNFDRWIHLARKINLQGEMKFKWDGEIHQVDRRTSIPKTVKVATLSKKTLIHMFSCKFCWIFQNNFFTELQRNSGSTPLRYYMRIWRQIVVTKNTVGLAL